MYAIRSYYAPFEPEKYTDDYRENLLTLIQQKIAGEEISLAPAKPEANVIDLMAALQASIEAVKGPIVTDPGETKPKRTTTRKKKEAAAESETQAETNEATPAAVTKPKRKPSSKTAKKTIS